jgi:hypothetical protein
MQTLTLTLDLKEQRTRKGIYLLDPYLTVTTAASAALGAHCADRGAQCVGTHRSTGSGTTAEPLDGGTHTRRGARAPARGPAAAPPPPSSRPPWWCSLVLSVFGG